MASVENVQLDRELRLGEPESRARPVRRARPAATLGKVGGGLLLLGAAALLGRATKKAKLPEVVVPRGFRASTARVMGDLGRGFLSGMVGTLAITTASATDALVTEAIRARREGRKPALDVGKAIVDPWSFSSGVVGKIFGITPVDSRHDRRLSVLAHWEYGSTWGLALPAVHALGLRGIPAMGAILAGQLGTEMIVMPAYKLFAGPSEWGTKAIVSSVYQHAIYAAAAVSAYEWLSGATI